MYFSPSNSSEHNSDLVNLVNILLSVQDWVKGLLADNLYYLYLLILQNILNNFSCTVVYYSIQI